MRYKVGDKVVIKKNLERPSFGSNYLMEMFYGKLTTVSSVYAGESPHYVMKETGKSIWNDDDIDHEETEKLRRNYSATYDGEIFRLINNITGKEYLSYNNDETEDIEKAIMMALLKEQGFNFGDIRKIEKDAKVNKRWMPKLGEKYYTITDYFEIYNDTYDGHLVDEELYRAKNMFKTLEKAERVRDRLKKILDEEKEFEDC